MNQAYIKYSKISNAQEGLFTGINKTTTKEIIIMINDSTHRQRASSQSTRKYPAPTKSKTNNTSQADGSEDTSLPKTPLLKHYKYPNNNTGSSTRWATQRSSTERLGTYMMPLITSE